MIQLPLRGIYSKELKARSQKDICTLMLIATLFTTPKMRKQSRYLSTDEWMNKIQYTYTTEHHSALKRKGVLTRASAYTNLEDFMVGKISQSRKTTYSMIPLT